MPDEDLPATGTDTMRRGLRIVWRGIRDEPRIFAIAVGGSAVYGIMTVGAAWVLGRLVDERGGPGVPDRSITDDRRPSSVPRC